MAKSKSANVLALEAARAEVKRLVEVVKLEKANARAVRDENRVAREAVREVRRARAIEKAQARLAKLSAPVGIKAKRASKRPSKVEVIELEAA